MDNDLKKEAGVDIDAFLEIGENKPQRAPRRKRRKETKKEKILRYTGRVLATLGVTLLLLVAFIFSVMCMLVYGPSPKAADLFVMSVNETSAIGFLADIFYTPEEIDMIIERNSIKDTNAVTDTSLVEIAKDDSDKEGTDNKDNTAEKEEIPAIEVKDVSGSTFVGKLMIVKDPSRLFVGTVPTFYEGSGETITTMAERYGAVAGINGGEFVDAGSYSYTAQPVGLVMVDGEIKCGDLYTQWHVTGITKDNILVVGNMTGQEAIDMGMRDCVNINYSIGPFLIVNGEKMDVSGVGGGLNPRTAIGQRSDGAILLLAVDGRQINSIGASFADLQAIMAENGAVNASTMDGGTSTQMYYDGKVINNPYSPTGPRKCPTGFLIKAE